MAIEGSKDRHVDPLLFENGDKLHSHTHMHTEKERELLYASITSQKSAQRGRLRLSKNRFPRFTMGRADGRGYDDNDDQKEPRAISERNFPVGTSLTKITISSRHAGRVVVC